MSGAGEPSGAGWLILKANGKPGASENPSMLQHVAARRILEGKVAVGWRTHCRRL